MTRTAGLLVLSLVVGCGGERRAHRTPVGGIGDAGAGEGHAGAGRQAALTATPKDAAGAALSGRMVTWASSDPAVATVSQRAE